MYGAGSGVIRLSFCVLTFMALLPRQLLAHGSNQRCDSLARAFEEAPVIDRELIVRDPATQNWDDPVFKSMEASVQKSLRYFDQVLWSPGSMRLDEGSFKQEFSRWMDESHRLSNYSKGAYHAALLPGVRRDRGRYAAWIPKSRRAGAVAYFDRVASESGIGPMIEGALPVRGISDQDQPANFRDGRHLYPHPSAVGAYVDLAAGYLFRIRALIKRGDAARARSLIGHYYHVLVNAHPYENVNNSLFANQMVHLLRLTGHPGVSHGDLDHLLMRMSSEQVDLFWPRVLEGKVKNAAGCGIQIK